MTIASALSPISLAQFFYPSGKLVRPARLYFYKPNTEDPYTVFTEATLGVPYEQPVLSGGSGRVPPIYIGSDPYRIRVFDSYGSLIEDIDYLPGAMVPSEDGGSGSGMTDAERKRLLKTGDMFFGFAGPATRRDDCVRANGGLLASPGFVAGEYAGQIERQNDDCWPLFEWLWGQDHELVNALAIVRGGRGESAEDDWALNKAIRLPDLRCRALIGIDDMGMGLTNRLVSVVVTPSAWAWSGVVGGNALTAQTVGHMPLHDHGAWTNNQNAALTPGYSGAGLWLTQPTQHYHTYWNNFIPDRAVSVSLGNGDGDEVMVMAVAPGAEPLAAGYDNTGGAYADVRLNEPVAGHVHSITQTPHIHGIPPQGGGVPIQTISPFCTAVVYIKL